MSNISLSGASSVVCNDGKVFINGENVTIPKGMRINSITITNDTIYIGGYQYFPKEKIFKRTLKALYYLYF